MGDIKKLLDFCLMTLYNKNKFVGLHITVSVEDTNWRNPRNLTFFINSVKLNSVYFGKFANFPYKQSGRIRIRLQKPESKGVPIQSNAEVQALFGQSDAFLKIIEDDFDVTRCFEK